MTVPTEPIALRAIRSTGYPVAEGNRSPAWTPLGASTTPRRPRNSCCAVLFYGRARRSYGVGASGRSNQPTSCPSGSDIWTAVYRAQRSLTPLLAAGL